MFSLVDLPMTPAEYEALPHLSTLTELELKTIKPFGFRCKDSQGAVRELVRGLDMFEHQWGAGMSLPERGWRHYRPIFNDGRTGRTVDNRTGAAAT